MSITSAHIIWSLPKSSCLMLQCPMPCGAQRRSRVAPAGYAFRLLLLLALSLWCGQSAYSHFNLNLNIRIFHVEHLDDGLDVYLRVPMPYLVANLAGPEQADGSRTPAPFTSNAMVDGELMHYIDYAALRQSPQTLAQLAANGHQIRSNGKTLQAKISSVLVYQGLTQPPFSTLQEAKNAFASNTQEIVNPPPFVGDAVADVLLQYRPGRKVTRYTLASSLNPGLEGQEDTANLIVDYYGQDPQIYRITGLLAESVEISRSVWAAAATFVAEGVRHILGGYDHVLFVACLVIGALTLTSLAWRITGFTIGHSITLSLGFFGYTPKAEWFVPLVETGIAASIVYAALLALLKSKNTFGSGFAVTTLIGMLHGFGFSFVLQEILGVSSPNIWISLLAFNVGVEIGQLAIIVLIWPVLMLITRYQPAAGNVIKWVVAVAAIGIASLWIGQRASAVLAIFVS